MKKEPVNFYQFAQGKTAPNRKIVLFASVFLLSLIMSCAHNSGKSPTVASDEGDDNKRFYGTPHKISIKQEPKDEVNITFGIISDTHVDATQCRDKPFGGDTFGWNDSDRMKHNRATIDDVNIDCKKNGCLGIVHLGDMVEQHKNEYSTQQVVAFRQLYENDYPGKTGGSIRGCKDTEYTAYNKGHKIKFPVFPTLGNHDAPCTSWHKPADYLDERITGAKGIVSHYDKDSYIWRWGSYYFIQLGLWAGSGLTEDVSVTDYNKLNWLKDFLKTRVNDNTLGVLIFQHYGWDGFSTEKRWWTGEQRDLELNVLCRRDKSEDPCDPYNVIGIFTGHAHIRTDIPIYPDGDKSTVYFNNFVIPDAGRDNQKQMGFSIVHLDGAKMAIYTKNRHTRTWSTDEDSITIGPRTPDSFWYTVGRDLGPDGDPKAWSQVEQLPYSDSIPAGGGAAIANINADTEPDMVLMGIEDFMEANQLYYRIVWNGNSSTVSDIIWGPHVGWHTAGGGAAIADVDGNGRPDLVLMAIDNPEKENKFWYVVGWNLGADGNPTSWSPIKYGPEVGWETAGGGAAMADIDGNGHPDLVLMAIDNPEKENKFWYVVGWNLGADGNPTSWSQIKYGPEVGWETDGGGAAMADVDGNGRPDLVLMAIDNPEKENKFWYVVGWNLGADGNPTTGGGCTTAPCWSPIKYGPEVGWHTAGGGAAMADVDGNGRPDLLFMDIDNP